jgi:hypothetical protein
MKKSILATAAGLLLMACSGMQKPAPAIAQPSLSTGDQVITSLERACLSDPLDPAKWEGLAAALESDGQRDRALRMYEQAATLRAHDVRRDYALLRVNGAVARAPDPELPSTLPRTEVRKLGAALVEVLRVPATMIAAPSPMAPSPAAPAGPAPMPAPAPVLVMVRLEISNGNGVTGAAARLARSLSVEGLKTVRLTNVKNFDVPLSRIEYRQEQQQMAESLSERLGLPLKAKQETSPRADVRIVLGHDATRTSRFK